MTRPRVVLAAAMAGLVLAGIAVAAWQARAAVRQVERQVLLAEAAIAARLLREPDAPARLTRLLGPRWARSAWVDPALFEPAIEAGGPPRVARAPVLDADGWDAVGQVSVTATMEHRGPPACELVAAIAVSCGALFALALACTGAAARRAAAPMGPVMAAWIALAALAAAWPVSAIARTSTRTLAELTDRRLALARDAIADHDAVAGHPLRPSQAFDLVGLRAVAAGGAPAEDPEAAAGFPADVAFALATSDVPSSGRLEIHRVRYAVAPAASMRLVLLPFEETHARPASMAAPALAATVAGAPLLLLAAALTDRKRLRRELTAWWFLSPGILHLAVFTFGPLIFAAWLSLHRYSLLDPARPFVGLDNYRELAGNGAFWHALANTALFTLHVPVSMALALALAMLVSRPGRASTLARAAFFLPSITSLAAVAMVWQWILNDQYGLANAALGAVGLPAVPWLSSPSVALVSVMIVAGWTSLGFQTVLIQAGLTAIPRELHDAARIDGAGAWRRFLHVTLPGLRPTLFFVLVTSAIGSFQVFGTVYVMTEGGPLHATDVAVFHIYEEAWELQRIGSAAAMSWVLFAAIFLVTWLHFRTLERRSA